MVWLSYLLEVKKAVLVALRVFTLKSSTAGSFAVPFMGLSQKKKAGDSEYVVLELIPLRNETNSSHTHKTGP